MASDGMVIKNMKTSVYRLDIDGLRAVAVLAVIAFHYFPSLMPGGFIGVDIFFVVSGFLITTLVINEQDENTFNYREFFVRRGRRLFPSLILVLSSCQVFGWFGLLSDEYQALGKHIAASAIFIPNFIFWSESGYFDDAATAKPLLHLWSLGVEAQFYLLWPAMIWLSLRYKLNLQKATGAMLLASLLLNLLMAETTQIATFFSPLSRLWELLSGCMLAFLIKSKANEFEALKVKLSSPMAVDNGLALLGLMLLAYGMFFFNQDMHSPGTWVLIPVIGTVLIILSGEKSWLNQTLLSNRFLVGIGLISFPLYLWHWPLLSFAFIIEGIKPNEYTSVVLVMVAFVLAGLTYYFIERPIRFGRTAKSTTRWLIATMMITGSLGLTTYVLDGFPGRVSDKEVKAQLADLNFDLPESVGWYCDDLEYDSPRCHSTGVNPSVVVIGDSHALMIYAALRERFNAKGQDIGLYGGSDGCPPLLNVIIQDQGGDPRNCLKKGTEAIERIIADPALHEVILTSRGPMYTTAKGFGDVESDQFGTWVLHSRGEKPGEKNNETVFAIGLSQTLDALLAAGKKVTYLHDVPELGFDIRSCSTFRPLSMRSKGPDSCAVSRNDFESRTKDFKRLVDNILAQRPEVKVVDLSEALCDKDWCYGSKNSALFYIDDDHLSQTGSAYVVRKLWDRF